MERAGRVRPPFNHAAHHIVASNATAAKQTVAILAASGIDINDADNGVFLPSSNHSRMHTPEYYKKINDRLSGLKPSQVRAELRKIGEELKAQTF